MSTANHVCMHCRIGFVSVARTYNLGPDADAHWIVRSVVCPACARLNIWMRVEPIPRGTETEVWIRPRSRARPPVPPDLPRSVAEPYEQAVAVLADSPMASAALSRRCLQAFIREVLGISKRNLSEEIDAMLATADLPTDLAKDVDAIRQIGNFAAHPVKSERTGELAEVEAGEAEWLLVVLEELFEHQFVRRAARREQRDRLNRKLRDHGRPPLRGDAEEGEPKES